MSEWMEECRCRLRRSVQGLDEAIQRAFDNALASSPVGSPEAARQMSLVVRNEQVLEIERQQVEDESPGGYDERPWGVLPPVPLPTLPFFHPEREDYGVTKVYHKSDRTNWGTPPELFEKVQASLQLSFDLDVCATEDNAKCERFLTPEDDALNPGTAWDGHYCWMNPPYGRGIGDWIRRARREGERRHVVALLPARVGTRWWWEGVVGSFPKAIIFLTGRVRFEGAENSAPFPSALVWWAGRRPGPPLGALWWDWKKDPPPFRHVGRTKERLMRYTAAIIATSDELPEWMNLSGQCRDDDA